MRPSLTDISRLALTATLALAAPVSAPASFIDSFWGGGDGVWSNPLLWSPTQVPDNGGGDSFDVFIDGDGNIASTVFLDQSATIDNLSVDEEDALVIQDLMTLRFTPDASIENRGEISVNLMFLEGPTQLFGGGDVQFDSTPLNQIFTSFSTASLDNVDNRIHGEGRLDLPQFHNRCLVDADAGVGKELRIVIGAQGVANDSTLLASDGVLVLQAGTGAGVVQNGPGGVIRAQGTSSIRLTGNTPHVRGGRLEAEGGATVELQGSSGNPATLEDVLLGGTIRAAGGSVSRLLGTVTNSGTFRLQLTDGLSLLILQIDGAVTLDGTGTMDAANGSFDKVWIEEGSPGSHLIHGVQHTLRGACSLGRDELQLTNLGTIVADQTKALTLDPGAGGLTNPGTLRAVGSGGMVLGDDAFTTSGLVEVATASSLVRTGDYVQTAGVTRVNGSLSATGAIDIQAGTLEGTGQVSGAVTMAGTLSPGASPGALAVVGSLALSSTAVTDLEVGGLTPGLDHDQVTVTGALTLGGTLRARWINGFTPTPGDTVTVLTAGSVTGTFDALDLPASVVVLVDADRVRLAGTGVLDVPGNHPSGARLLAFPNPAHGDIVLRYGLAASGPAELQVFDATGRKIRSWAVHATTGQVRWSAGARDVASGIYFLRLVTPEGIAARQRVVRLP